MSKYLILDLKFYVKTQNVNCCMLYCYFFKILKSIILHNL